MIAVFLLILLLLVWVFVQDAVSRSVYWFTFPLLAILYALLHIVANQPVNLLLSYAAENLIFLSTQFLLVWVYFSIKAKRLINITASMIGWGDILFLVSLAFYFSLLNFIVFYVLSIVLVLLIAIISGFLTSYKKIPLAGLQALIFALFLTVNWLCFHFDMMNDDRLMGYLIK